MYQGGSDDFSARRTTSCSRVGESSINFEAEVAVITGDGRWARRQPAHPPADSGQRGVAAHLIAPELVRGFGFLQSKPAPSFAPVAVTPGELGEAWSGGKVHLSLRSTVERQAGRPATCRHDMVFNFPQLVSHLCKSRNARADTIVGSGTVSNKMPAAAVPASPKRLPWDDRRRRRQQPFMLFGDTMGIEMLDGAGKSIFGAIGRR